MSAPIPAHEFVVRPDLVYLDHAGVAPISRRAAEAVQEWVDVAAGEANAADGVLREHIERVRSAAAEVCGVPAHDLAFVKNTTEGLSFVAGGLDWAPGDRVIVPDEEFPSTIYPWLALEDRGVEVHRLPPVGEGRTIPLELFEAALRERPARLVCTSWVQFSCGWRVDLAELGRLCREYGALLCVDVIQGLGVLPADLEAWGVDFASADGHKWLCAPEGIGVFYVRAARRALLRPLEPGWHAVAHRREWTNLDLDYDDTARRFEGGTLNAVGIYGLGGSLDLLRETGVEAVWAHVDALCTRTAEGLRSLGARILSDRSDGGRSGILTFAVPGHDPVEVRDGLGAEGFVVAAPRGGGVRVSPHGYTSESEMDRLVEAVAAMRLR